MATRKITVAKAMSVDEATHTLTAVMSTNSVDRDGDIVEPRGARLENFKANPVVLWAHDKTKPPIGKIKELYTSDDAVMGVIEFDKDDPFAAMIFNKYAKGFLSAWSIGFAPEMKAAETISDENGQVTGYKFKEWDLLELSAVPVPANPQALVREMKEADPALVKRFAEAIENEDLRKTLEKEFTKEDHNSEVAENEPNWGSVEKPGLPLVAFAWERPGTSPDEKSTWGFPHHWVQNPGNKNDAGIWTTGELYLHEGGLRAAWAAAMGARSGKRAPASVINHLQKHRRALGINEQQRGKLYTLELTTDARLVRTEKDFEELGEDYTAEDLFEAVEVELAPNVFKKSIDERGDKIPTTYSVGDAFKMVLDFEVIQVQDNLIKEAKVLAVEVSLPRPVEKAASIPEEEPEPAPKAVEEGPESITAPAVDAKGIVDDLDVELRGYAAKIAAL